MAALRGSPVVVTFWASWCVPCRAEMPELAKVIGELNAEAGPQVRVVAINTSDDPIEANPVVRDPAYAAFVFGVDADGSLAEAWGATALPTTVLVRPDGKVGRVKVGFDPQLRYGLRSWVRSTRPKDATAGAPTS